MGTADTLGLDSLLGLSREDPADEVETPRAKRKRASIPGTGRPKSPGSESPGSEPA